MELFYVAALTAWLGSVGMGTNLGYSSPAIISLRDGNSDFTITPDDEPWVGSSMALGALVGGLAAGFLADLLGRKLSMIISSLGFIAGWVTIAAARNMVMLCAGRMITGGFTGLVSLVVPVYVSEISKPEVRGMLGSGTQLSVTVGILGVFIVGKYVNWSDLAFLCIIPTSLLGVLMLFMTESPERLLTKGRRDDALKSLKFLFGDNTDQEAECRAIEEVINSSPREKFHVSELKNSFLYKPILISIFLMFAQQFSGINAVMFYAVSIFEQARTSIPPEDCMVIIGAVQVVATLVATMVMDKGGRRVMLLLSAALLGTSLFVLGTCHYVKTMYGDEKVPHVGWLPLVCLSVFITGFSCGIGPIPWLMMGELLSVRALGFTSSLCTGYNWALAFIVTKEFSYTVSALDAHGTYWFFTGVMAVSFCIILAAVPETKGKSLAQIEMTFRGIHVGIGDAEAQGQVSMECAESRAAPRAPSLERDPSKPNEPQPAPPENEEDPASIATSRQPDDAHQRQEEKFTGMVSKLALCERTGLLPPV